MASEEGVPLANEVSDAFVKQYFRVLEQFPEEARKLYVDTSVVSRPGTDGTMISFASIEAINEQILSCDYTNAKFDIVSVDSQHSFEKGIVIMVIGFLTGKDKLRRKFSQSFYLAHQNSAYVVLNDILRYVDEISSSQTSLTVLPQSNDELNLTEPDQKIDGAVENSKDGVEITPVENGKIENSDGKSETAEKATKPVAEAIPVKAQTDVTKRSFAAIVQSMAHNAAPFQVKEPAQRPKPTGQPRVAPVTQTPGAVVISEKKIEDKIIEEPGTSIFVANLPMTAMPAELNELFKGFGPIKENGIQVRSSRGSGICFGFVAFESASSVQSVLQAVKASPFMLADRKLRVKEKQVIYNGSKPSGRNGGSNRSNGQNGSSNGDDLKRRDNSNRNRRYGGRNGHERRAERNEQDPINHEKANHEGGEVLAAAASSQV